jgi:hypothetical protein
MQRGIEAEAGAAHGAHRGAVGAEGRAQSVDNLGERFVGNHRLAGPEAGEDRVAGYHGAAGCAEEMEELKDARLAGDLLPGDAHHLAGGVHHDVVEAVAGCGVTRA